MKTAVINLKKTVMLRRSHFSSLLKEILQITAVNMHVFSFSMQTLQDWHLCDNGSQL